ncbi:DUF6985 domain-containing protein [Mesobacillus zeae]|uniref:DUF6985 domain-containing protein n=1 Tax=Mesobacillus zeae TaxID=1917180 RepID=A0A398B865_9BACI|nr:hypothetical protein [Mesobacillus zeae]RID86007.1 hypothetical protein D1970_07825 [Mesobacillus zeae]
MLEEFYQEDDGMSGTVYSKLFDQNLDVWIEENVSNEYAISCIESLNSMNSSLVDDICKAAIAYCEDFCEMVGQQPPAIERIRDVLHYIEFGTMNIEEPEDDKIPVVHLGGGCEWEQEHGIELIIRNGELIYLGAYNGEWAWGEPDHYESDYNYAFVIKQKK